MRNLNTHYIMQRFIRMLQCPHTKREPKAVAVGVIVTKDGCGKPASVGLATHKHALIAGMNFTICVILVSKLRAGGELRERWHWLCCHSAHQFYFLRYGGHILCTDIQ